MSEAAATRAWLSPRWKHAASLVLILGVAAALRLAGICDEAAWYDEIISIEHLDDAAGVWDYLERLHPRTPAPPFYFVTQYVWAQIAGPSVLASRLLSVAYGVAGLWLLFALTRRLFTPQAAAIATAWTAFLIWHIYHSQGIRFYALTHLFVLLSVYTFVRLVQKPSGTRFAAEGAVSSLMVWTHPQSALLFAAKGVFLLAYRRGNPQLIICWIVLHAIVAGSLVAYLFAIDREAAYALSGWIDKPGLWGPGPSWESLVEIFSGLMPFAPTNGVGRALLPLRAVLWPGLIVAHVAGAAAGFAAVRRNTRGIAGAEGAALAPNEKAALLLLWLLLPPVTAFVLSYVWQPVFLGRYLLYAAFPAYMLLGTFLATCRRWAVAGFFALLIGYGGLFYFPGPIRTPFDDVAAAIAQDRTPVEAVYVDNVLLAPPLGFYWDGDGPEILGARELESLDEALRAGDPRGGSSRWLVFSLPHRFRYWKKLLEEAGVPYEDRTYSAGRPIRVIRVPLAAPAARGKTAAR